MHQLTPEQRFKVMQGNTKKDTKIELILRKALWHNGVRYRKNVKDVIGTPDICIKKYKIAIFCDGDFWHGKDFSDDKFKTNKKFWDNKIKRNKERDLETTIKLRDNGWTVLRFWESEIKASLAACVKVILHHINTKKRKI